MRSSAGSVDLENMLGQIKADNQYRHQGYSLRVNPEVYLATFAGSATGAIHTIISEQRLLGESSSAEVAKWRQHTQYRSPGEACIGAVYTIHYLVASFLA